MVTTNIVGAAKAIVGRVNAVGLLWQIHEYEFNRVRLIIRVSAFSQRTGNIRIKRNETSIANGREGGERADTCSDTFVSRMGNLSHILWS